MRRSGNWWLRGLVALTFTATWLLLGLLRLDVAAGWGAELLRYMPYPVLVLPLVGLLVASWRLGWLWRGLAAGALLVFLVGVMDLCLGRPEAGSIPMRVMAYNIKSYLAEDRGKGYGPLVNEIRRQRPDLLVMEDAQRINLRTDERLPPEFHALQQGRHVFRQGQYVVMSRDPIRDCQPVDMTVTDEPSQFLHCVIISPIGDVHVFVTHFMTPRDGLNAARHERVRGLGDWQVNQSGRWLQSRRLAGEVREVTGPVIVAGDLNATEQSPVIGNLLQTGLRDAFSAAGRGWGYTHGHSLRLGISFLRIDHILVNRQLAVQGSWVGGAEGSEHRPVIADLWLRPGPPP